MPKTSNPSASHVTARRKTDTLTTGSRRKKEEEEEKKALCASELLPSVLPEQKGPEQKEPDQPSLRRRAQGQVFKRVQHAPPCSAVLEQMIQARMGEIQAEDAAKEAAELCLR